MMGFAVRSSSDGFGAMLIGFASLSSLCKVMRESGGAPGCPGCGWAEVSGPVTFSIRTEDADGPMHCHVCGRSVVVTMALSDEEALIRDASQ